MSAVPKVLRNSLMALAALGVGVGGGYFVDDLHEEAKQNSYLHAVAADPDTSDALKIAMVMAHYYESSNRHIGKPYIDKLGKGRPLTVCNGITGAGVYADRYYTPADCYELEKGRYLAAERDTQKAAPGLAKLDPMTQASFIDFVHNVGIGAFQSSTMLRKLNAGDVVGACRENPRWVRGTVNGVSTVLPGLVVRRDSNAELCEHGLVP